MIEDGSEAILAQLARLYRALDEGDALAEGGQDWADAEAVPLAQDLVPILTGATHDATGALAGPGGINVYADTPYARVIEYGGENRPAHPFIEPAVRGTISRLADYLGLALSRRIA